MPRRRRLAAAGFSLTELLVTLAVITIIAAFALPNYTRQLQQARRTDAMDALLQIAGEQEKYFLRHNRYADALDQLGFDPPVSSNGYYALSLERTDDGFIVSAVPNGKPQSADGTCAEFTFNEQGRKTAADASGTPTTNDCWR